MATRRNPRPRVTLECLHSFAKHCPHLADLTTTFDGTVLPISDIDSTNRVCQDRLRSLNADHSAIFTARSRTIPLSNLSKPGEYFDARSSNERPDLDEVDALLDVLAIGEEAQQEWGKMNASDIPWSITQNQFRQHIRATHHLDNNQIIHFVRIIIPSICLIRSLHDHCIITTIFVF
ncbi:hypothetical protein C8R44DRAFT_866217 [Mycena epipterygia]|nr:hypothetical protein C8R44DRAFT_866217 [Mycena epipterygia]